MRWFPFIEWRPKEIGLGFSLSVERELIYSLEPGDKSLKHVWSPNIWIHIGPLVAGIGLST